LQLKCDKELVDLATMFDPILTAGSNITPLLRVGDVDGLKHVNAYWCVADAQIQKSRPHKVRAWRALGDWRNSFRAPLSIGDWICSYGG